MFLCDYIGAMHIYINSVKSRFKNIIDFILENNPYADIKISIVDCTLSWYFSTKKIWNNWFYLRYWFNKKFYR